METLENTRINVGSLGTYDKICSDVIDEETKKKKKKVNIKVLKLALIRSFGPLVQCQR
jgi:hypothetical protein